MPLHFTPEFCEVDETREHILLIRYNRPRQLNSMPTAMHAELSRVMKYYDINPDLWVAVVTGSGRAFSAGFDLKEAAGLSKLVPDLTDLDPNGAPPPQLSLRWFTGAREAFHRGQRRRAGLPRCGRRDRLRGCVLSAEWSSSFLMCSVVSSVFLRGVPPPKPLSMVTQCTARQG